MEVITVGLFVLYIGGTDVKLRHTAGGKFIVRGTHSQEVQLVTVMYTSELTHGWSFFFFFLPAVMCPTPKSHCRQNEHFWIRAV